MNRKSWKIISAVKYVKDVDLQCIFFLMMTGIYFGNHGFTPKNYPITHFILSAFIYVVIRSVSDHMTCFNTLETMI